MAAESSALSSARIVRALALEHPYRWVRERNEILIPLHARWTPAAVLVLLADPGPSVLVTRRTESVDTHKGQMAFPGGVREEGETDAQAALRETYEELGIAPEAIEILGELPPLRTPTGFDVTPVVGRLRAPHTAIPLTPSPAEIAGAYWIALSDLAAEGVYRVEELERGSQRFSVDVYELHGHRIWGATGAMLRGFLERLDKISEGSSE